MTDRALPELMAQLHQLPFDHARGAGIDFEPQDELTSAADTESWIRAWTGVNLGFSAKMARADSRRFGWWAIGRSEGELGVVARDFADSLWLLAGGFGPYEAVAYGGEGRPSHPAFKADSRAVRLERLAP
jgi:hypothetical protein